MEDQEKSKDPVISIEDVSDEIVVIY